MRGPDMRSRAELDDLDSLDMTILQKLLADGRMTF